MIKKIGENIFNKSAFIEILKQAENKAFYFRGTQKKLKKETAIKKVSEQTEGGELWRDTEKDIYIISLARRCGA